MGKLAVNTFTHDVAHATYGVRSAIVQFTTANTADPLVANTLGGGVQSITRIGVGQFRITFVRAFRQLLGAAACPLGVNNRLGSVIAFSAGSIRNPATVDVEIDSAIGTAVETTGLKVSVYVDFQDVVNHKGK